MPSRPPTTAPSKRNRSKAGVASLPRSQDDMLPKRKAAEVTAEYQDKIIVAFDKQRDLTAVAAEEAKDAIELMQKSIKKQLSEAKRMPDHYEAKTRESERQLNKLKEEKAESDTHLKQALASRSRLKQKVDALEKIIVKQQNDLASANTAKTDAESALAPSSSRVASLNSIGSRVHVLVIKRVRELAALTHQMDATRDDKEADSLHRDKVRLEDALFRAFEIIEPEYNRLTVDGTYPALGAGAMPEEHDPYNEALGDFSGDAGSQVGENGSGSEERGYTDELAEREASVGMFVSEETSEEQEEGELAPPTFEGMFPGGFASLGLRHGQIGGQQAAQDEGGEQQDDAPESEARGRRGSIYGLPSSKGLKRKSSAK